ncbi:ribonuclease P protein component [Salegentibacter flavus]|uniref:Ribonuclease P protein component n=1 Tax=Salegentibacter flavus TaxID=287099 RepID=A0A1I5A2N0_9FLAO|nr:ribonuclease P protein component [Salegentibacter flavus]SFN56785.1 ribonuclease P protein component [Salegentibacter flavus]
MDERFGKQDKLKSERLIEKLFTEGKSVKKFPLKLVYLPINASDAPQLKTGISVPKKLVKTAPGRNRIKRLMREAFRKNKYLVTNNIPGSYAFMFIYISRDKTDYESLNRTMIKLLKTFVEKEKQE